VGAGAALRFPHPRPAPHHAARVRVHRRCVTARAAAGCLAGPQPGPAPELGARRVWPSSGRPDAP